MPVPLANASATQVATSGLPAEWGCALEAEHRRTLLHLHHGGSMVGSRRSQ